MLRRGLVLDLSIAMGMPFSPHASIPTTRTPERRALTNTNWTHIGLGTTFGYLWWYGFHLPRVRARDSYYARLEDQRAREAGFK